MKKLTAIVSALVLALTLTFSSFAAPSSEDIKKAAIMENFFVNFSLRGAGDDEALKTKVETEARMRFRDLGDSHDWNFNEPYFTLTSETTVVFYWWILKDILGNIYYFIPELGEIEQYETINLGFSSGIFSSANPFVEVSLYGDIIAVDGKSYKEILVELGLEEPEESDELENLEDIHELLIMILAALGFIGGILLFRHLRK